MQLKHKYVDKNLMQESHELKYWRRFIQGEIHSLSKLYLLYVDDLFFYGMKIYSNEHIVKDAIQDVFIQLLINRNKIKPTNNPKVYILRSLRNKILDELRSKNRKKNHNAIIFDKEDQFEEDIENKYITSEEEKNIQQMMTAALSKLSKHQREAIFLKYTNNCTYEQIAEIMEINISSARTLIYRSLKQIKSFVLKNNHLIAFFLFHRTKKLNNYLEEPKLHTLY